MEHRAADMKVTVPTRMFANIVPKARHCLRFAVVTSEEIAADLIDQALIIQSARTKMLAEQSSAELLHERRSA
jgi:hypothetical protein